MMHNMYQQYTASEAEEAQSGKPTEPMVAPQRDEAPDLEEVSEETLSQITGGGLGLGSLGPIGKGLTLAAMIAPKALIQLPELKALFGPTLAIGSEVLARATPNKVVTGMVDNIVKQSH